MTIHNSFLMPVVTLRNVSIIIKNNKNERKRAAVFYCLCAVFTIVSNYLSLITFPQCNKFVHS